GIRGASVCCSRSRSLTEHPRRAFCQHTRHPAVRQGIACMFRKDFQPTLASPCSICLSETPQDFPGMAVPMRNNLIRTTRFWIFWLGAGRIWNRRKVEGQLGREDTAARAQSSAPKPAASSAQTPTGKRRVSQEFQITGDQVWMDTSIAVQAGEHIVAKASGK